MTRGGGCSRVLGHWWEPQIVPDYNGHSAMCLACLWGQSPDNWKPQSGMIRPKTTLILLNNMLRTLPWVREGIISQIRDRIWLHLSPANTPPELLLQAAALLQ